MRNVDQMVYYYKIKSLHVHELVQITVNKFFGQVDTRKIVMEDFVKIYDEALDELDYVCDALQAQRPFYNDLLKAFMQNYHIEILKFACDLWNNNHLNFGGAEVVLFFKVIYKQKDIISSYGMREPRFDNSINELCSAFAIKTFRNVMPMI